MYYILFILIALLSGASSYFGWTRATLWAFLLGTGLITLLGVVAINEGLQLGTEAVWNDSGELISLTPQTITAQNDIFVYIVGWGMFYGGLAVSGLGIGLGIIPFIKAVQQYS